MYNVGTKVPKPFKNKGSLKSLSEKHKSQNYSKKLICLYSLEHRHAAAHATPIHLCDLLFETPNT
jgi:hypothetical protein